MFLAHGLGAHKEIDPRLKYSRDPKRQHDIAAENFRVMLWDVQRRVAVIGTKKIMNQAGLDIKSGRYSAHPRVRNSVPRQNNIVLITEVLEVTRVPSHQTGTRVNRNNTGHFIEGPDIGSAKGRFQVMVYLETRLREIVPPGTSNDAVRAELERQINHLGAAAHLLMVAEQQNTFQEVRMKTQASIFIPCLRPRFNGALGLNISSIGTIPYAESRSNGDILHDFFTISVLTPNSIHGGSLWIAPPLLGGWHRRRIAEDVRKVTVLLHCVWAAPPQLRIHALCRFFCRVFFGLDGAGWLMVVVGDKQHNSVVVNQRVFQEGTSL
ncbi:hypothetical protein B0H13DRAFT_2342852 [Mycena leptocephala]|nr:hypothetical protein B0H13DRAFT_2342852 [Mycena leptocephala]